MKLNYLIKATPIFSILLLIIFINIGNQKEYTKLRVLIWNTPSLTLGTYLSISLGTGFILSYLITTNLAKINPNKQNQSLRFKNDEQYEQTNEYIETDTNQSYENTLIERDIKDPSPTINASFRIIGKTDRNITDFRNNKNNYSVDTEFEQKYDEQADNDEIINQVQSLSSDWNDDSYSKW